MALKPLGDRRTRVRFDVVGALWGLLELTETARIVNVSNTGALIDSPLPAALDSTQTVRVMVEGQAVALDARVRHIRRINAETGAPRYLLGLEFMSPPESVLQSIEQLAGGQAS
jgi:hypothetical protein